MFGLFRKLRDSFRARRESRRLCNRWFSGRAVVVEIGRRESRQGPLMTLHYRNGLLLSLGEEGLLDFKDPRFRSPAEGENLGGREARVLLHTMVLKSLIRYMVQPHMDPDQRERAAEAASRLYLAEVEATTDWLPGPAAAVVHGSHPESTREEVRRSR